MQAGIFSIQRDYTLLLDELISETPTGITRRKWLYFAEGEVYVRVMREAGALSIRMANIKLKNSFQRRGLFSMMMRANEGRIRRAGGGRVYVENVQNPHLEAHLRKQDFTCADPTVMCPTFYRTIAQ